MRSSAPDLLPALANFLNPGASVMAGSRFMNGTEGGVFRKMVKIYIHPNYQAAMERFDVALIKLNAPFDMNTNVTTVPALPKSTDMDLRDKTNMTVWVTGFGITVPLRQL
jgi:hypothetical protein